MAMTLAQFRSRYPAYNDISDNELADRIYNKWYSAMPRAEFDKKIDYSSKSADDDLDYRSEILPIGRTKEGKIVPALPQGLYDAARITKQLMTGERAPADVTPKEALSMASIGVGAAPVVEGAGAVRGAVSGLRALEKPAIPTTAELKATSQAAYKASENAGVEIKPEPFRAMVKGAFNEAKEAGLDKDIHPKAAAAFGRLLDEIRQGASPTLKELDTLRQVAGAAAKSIDQNDRRMARIITNSIDTLIDNLRPEDVIGGDTEAAKSAIKDARQHWSRHIKSDTIDTLFEKATNAASGTPAEGLEGQLRKQFKALADNPKRMRQFNSDEQDAIKTVARGSGPVQQALVKLGKLSPNAGFFSAVLSGSIGMEALQNPKLLAIPTVGAIARWGAGRIRKAQAEKVRQMVRGGKPAAEFFKKRSQLRGSALGGLSKSGAGIGLSTLPALLPGR
jgi:hypothetical protein